MSLRRQRFEILSELTRLLIDIDHNKAREWTKKRYRTRIFADLENEELEELIKLIKEGCFK